MQKVSMYSTGYCPYCTRAEMLLKQRGVEQIEKLRIDAEPQLRAEMMARTGRRTVPQIYIGDTHVGGFDDLAALDRAGGLLPLLNGDAVPGQ
ncbi:glutaredoxin 3 [Pigmentiphaga humi]|nr:glutaredoxin 3 [Pigmentiphaga humi]